ncbi:hypothetical protein L1887_53229 [Cichorium endivia]|nr:hypothetical protein L1887_53229 [Cichorium endivia]
MWRRSHCCHIADLCIFASDSLRVASTRTSCLSEVGLSLLLDNHHLRVHPHRTNRAKRATMDEAALRAMMPMSFGKRPAKKAPAPTPSDAAAPVSAASSSSLSASVLGKRPAQASPDAEEDDGLTPEERRANAEAEERDRERRAQGLPDSDDDDDDDSDDSDDDVDPPPPPAASHAPPKPDVRLPPLESVTTFSAVHTKTISALAVDSAGARFALGSYDYTLSLYDYGGMNASLSPFRTFEPGGSVPVVDLSFSRDAASLLVVSSTSQAKVYSRDGAQMAECAKGDPYLRDMRHTNGHVASLTAGQFHPNDATRFVTAGEDSTVRIWDVETAPRKQLDTVVLKSKARGTRTKVTALTVTPAELLVAAARDGSLNYWDLRANLNARPRGTVEHAHAADTVTSSVAVRSDGRTLATRGGDDTVKLWDLRSFRSPLAVREDLPTTSPHASVLFDPYGGETVVVGTGDGDGKVCVLSSVDLSTEHVHAVASPVRMVWNAATDHFYATSRRGTLSVMHSSRSTKGISLALARPAKASSQVDSYPVAVPDGGVGMSEAAKRRKLAKTRRDAAASHMPQPPVAGPGSAGRIGSAANTHLVQSLYKPPVHEDPREALLKYADKEAKFTKAWEKTQPKPIYDHQPDEKQ